MPRLREKKLRARVEKCWCIEVIDESDEVVGRHWFFGTRPEADAEAERLVEKELMKRVGGTEKK